MKSAKPYPEQLSQFIRHVLVPAVPRPAWWVLGAGMASWLNLLFLTELWPHHPGAEHWFAFVLIFCVLALLWLGAYTAQQVWRVLAAGWWNTLRLLNTLCGYALASFLTVVMLILCL